MKPKLSSSLEYVFQYMIVALFLYTGILKIIDFDVWQRKVLAIDYVRVHNLSFISYIIPTLEMLISIFFISNIKPLWTALSSFILMSFFTGYVFYKIYISDDSLCPCGGVFSQLTLDKHLIINIIFTFITSILFLIKYSRQRTISW